MSTLPRLIAMVGEAGAGKDTAAAYLREQHAYRPMAFAEPLRDMLTALMQHVPESDDYLHCRELKELPVPSLGYSYREMAQTLGTEWGRQHMPGIWVAIARSRIEQLWAHDPLQRIVITDTRFPDELGLVRQLGGVVWRIKRRVAAVRQHVSEEHAALMAVDQVIDNNRSLDDLYREIGFALHDCQEAA